MTYRKWLIPLVLFLFTILLVWLSVTDHSLLRGRDADDPAILLCSGWQAENGLEGMQPITLPARLTDETYAIVHRLPAWLPTDACLYLKTNYQQVSAQIGGIDVPVSGVTFTAAPAVASDLAWTVITLSPDMAGKSVRLRFSNAGNKPWVEVYGVRIGSKSDIRLTLLLSAIPPIIISLLLALLSLSFFGYFSVQSRRYKHRMSSRYTYLIWFILLCSLWFYLDSDIIGVNLVGNQAALVVSYLVYLTLPVPFLLFIGAIQPLLRRVSRMFVLLYCVNLFADSVCILTGVLTPWMALALFHGITGAYLLLVVLRLLRTRNMFSGRNPELFTGMLITSAAAIVSVLLFYLFPHEDHVNVFRYGVIALVVTLIISVQRANVKLLSDVGRLEELRIREEEYRIAVRQSDKYVVRFDVGTRAILQGERKTTLLGDRAVIEDMPSSVIAMGQVAEESIAAFRAFFDDMCNGKPSGGVTVSLRNPDGAFGWYHADFTMIYTADHQPLQAVISYYDITDQHEKELAYEKWTQSYTEMPSVSINYYEYNLSRDLFTREAGLLLPPLPGDVKSSLDRMIAHLAEHYVIQTDIEAFKAFFQRARLLEAYAHGIRNDRLEYRRLNAQGQTLWTLASVQLIADPYSNDVLCFLLLKDEDQEKRDAIKVRDRSNTDPLTGLLNRSAFEEAFDALLQTSDTGTLHALMMIDVDGFKRVNDSFGHQFGDRVLIDIANSLRAMMRTDDLIGRIGGDEYMVCLRNVKDDTGFLERRSAQVCQSLNRQFGNDLAISGSIGLALYPHDGNSFDQLYKKSDKALYYAKHHGKNRYIFYNDSLLKGDETTPSAQSVFLPPVDIAVMREAEQEPVRTLLIVDDVEMNRDLLCEIFRDEYNLLTADSGKACMALMSDSDAKITAVLLDLLMPGLSGLDVLKQIQADVYMASIPVIVTSAADETEFSLKAIDLGATDFVSKPIDPRLVRLRVRNAIHKRETEELRAQNRYLLVQKSDESRHQNELRYLAEHDPLTHICNKATFYVKTRAMLDKAPDTLFVMVAFDIEKFRVINDIFGHKEGDRLLCAIARYLQNNFGGDATFSRISSDNFALCMPYRKQALEARVAQTEADLKAYDLPFEIVLTYGFFIIDDRTLDVSIMHDRAEMAKRTVKGNYVNRFAYYDDKLRQALIDELEIVSNISTALESRQFEIYLQPKCVLTTGEITGAEALVRWNHPTRGILQPSAFVPLFEKNGLILKLDAYVWEQVCALLRKWMDQNDGKSPIPLSMNVSRVNIYNPALVATLCALADKYAVPRRMMELEITESAYTQDPKQLSETITELRSRGFSVQMDDFGSAYSSLNMLKEISVDLLKLDMRFLYGNDQNGRGGTILSNVVRMARYLSLPIVAEGVETAEQARFLSSIGCMLGQGYYFHRPMPVADFEALLLQQPHASLGAGAVEFPEAALRRVWSMEGDFSLMLDSIPCAASLCEQDTEKIEILRVNQEYLALTGDSKDWLYRWGNNVRSLTTPRNYQILETLFSQALTTKEIVSGVYHRYCENKVEKLFRLKIRFLTGDRSRGLYFVTYQELPEGGDEL